MPFMTVPIGKRSSQRHHPAGKGGGERPQLKSSRSSTRSDTSRWSLGRGWGLARSGMCSRANLRRVAASPSSVSSRTIPASIGRQRSAGSSHPARHPTARMVQHERTHVGTPTRTGNHLNIVEVLGVYYTSDERGSCMSLVMEYVSKTLGRVLSFLGKRKMRMKPSHAQSYSFQVFAWSVHA